MSRRRFALLLGVLLVGSFALHAHRASNPTSSYQSADERAYGGLGIGLAEDHQYGDRTTGALHWPPGAPALYGVAHALFPDAEAAERSEVPAGYWFQAGISTLTALLCALLALVLAGPVAGLLAGALVGFYPPLILATGEQISEPFGAFWVAGSMLAFALAARSGRWPWFLAAGALLGAAVLTRTDLLPVVGVLPVLVLVLRRRLAPALALGVGAALAIAPWSLYATQRAGTLVPVTTGSPSALFVGTYLPGKGNTIGMKRDLEEETWARYPKLRGTPGFELPAENVLGVVAARHPDLPRDEALALEGRRNLVRYGLKQPLRFGQMMLDKGIQRMWGRYARGGARPTSNWLRAWHVLLVIVGFGGVLCGLRARRDLVLAAILAMALTSTAVHAIVVSQARYNLPLMPVLIAAGVAGAFMVRARLREPLPAARARGRPGAQGADGPGAASGSSALAPASGARRRTSRYVR